jgi:NTP pyrophosphatase (non-canonical NTP hydrolase)
MDKLTEAFRKFNEERDWDQFHTPENLAKSISIEAGELLECFQWNNDYDKEHLCEELADVLSYCIMLADRLDVDIEEIVLDKLEKTKKKYPVELARGSSEKYTELKKR